MQPSASSVALSVVTLGGDAGLPAMLQGIGEAFYSPRWSRGPSEAQDPPPAREAIATADLIVLGPGSLHTSLLPILRVREIAEEIGRSGARVVLVMNLMTEPGGTDGYVASDCVLTIRRHAPEVHVHDVLINDAPIRSDRVVSYARQGALPMGYDTEALEALGCRPVKCDLLWDGPVVRHDPGKLWRALFRLGTGVETRARRARAPSPQRARRRRSSDDAGGATVPESRGLISDREDRRIGSDAQVSVSLEERLDIICDDDVIAARRKGRVMAAEIGFAPMDQAMLAAVITELARNIIDYAGRGEVLFHTIEDGRRRGIEVIARDQGPGIPNIKEALQASYSVAGGLGLGLKGAKGLMDSLDIISVPGKRTTVTARKWQS